MEDNGGRYYGMAHLIGDGSAAELQSSDCNFIHRKSF